ncbi:MAG: hypothetical protein QNJ98_19020 [Planctomycetota bacterium]|nr:hypothetical protein [Planctomycetota bacterium]
MLHARVVLLMPLFAAFLLAGCQTLDTVENAATSLERMGDTTTELAAGATETIDTVKSAIAALDVQITNIGKQVEAALPATAETTRSLLETINETAAATGTATAKMIERSAVAVEELTPEVKGTLASMRETVEITGRSLDNISKRMDGTMAALQDLATHLRESTAAGAQMVEDTQKQLSGALAEAQKTLGQTTESMLRLEQESVVTMRSMQDSLKAISRTFKVFAEDDDEQLIRNLGKRIDSLVTLFLWVQILGVVTLIAVTVLFIHHKATTKGRHEAMARKLGLDPKA